MVGVEEGREFRYRGDLSREYFPSSILYVFRCTLTFTMVLCVRKFVSVYSAAYAQSSFVDLCKTCTLLYTVRHSSTEYEAKEMRQHLPTSKSKLSFSSADSV